MDKYEYKISVEEIKRLIKQGQYAEAAQIADTIDWRKEKGVMLLCTISDLYKINKRYEDARDVLMLAYDQRPGGRTICYSLCELCLKTDQLVQALEFFKEFAQIAPNDPGILILRYKIYQTQGVSLEERIQVLEELKKRDYREKWGYELASLYHQIGEGEKCVAACDDMMLWFGEGRYVYKAMELKMQHEPLTQQQQYRYDHRFDAVERETAAAKAEAVAAKETEEEVLVKTVDVSQFNTMNLQAELAAGLKEVLEQEAQKQAQEKEEMQQPEVETETPVDDQITKVMDAPAVQKAIAEEMASATEAPVVEESVIEESVIEETTEEVVEEVAEEVVMEPVAPITQEIVPIDYGKPQTSGEDVYATKIWGREEVAQRLSEIKSASDRAVEAADYESQNSAEGNALQAMYEELEALKNAAKDKDVMTSKVMLSSPPAPIANVLAQESDGQISLVVPEREQLEKQITGQLSIEEVLADWEEMKRKNQEKNEEALRQRVLQDTGELFSEFDAAVKNGLLEKMEAESMQSQATVEYIDEAALDEIPDAEPEELAVEEVVEEAPVEEIPVEETPVEEAPEEIIVVEEPIVIEAPEEEAVAEEPQAEEPAVQESFTQEIMAQAIEEAIADTKPAPVAPAKEPVKEQPVKEENAQVRALTKEEKELFGAFVQTKASKEQLLQVLDNVSIASYTGNVIVTGVAGLDTLTFAKNLIKDVQSVDNNFTGECAKISSETLNKKSVTETIEKFKNGALIIEKASGLSNVIVNKICQCLQREDLGIIIILIDTKKRMDTFLAEYENLTTLFNARIDLQVMSNDALANFGKKYAREKEYAIDDNMGMLALHTRIENMQTSEHAVSILDVKEIIDEAIKHVNRKTPKHFFDILFGRRYDDEDMIILNEKDFVEK